MTTRLAKGTKVFKLYIHRDLIEDLRVLAQEDSRSMSNYIVNLVRKDIAEKFGEREKAK